jgi:hypothetical protein
MRKLILILALFFAINVYSKVEYNVVDRQFNTVIVSVPSVITIESYDGYSVSVVNNSDLVCNYDIQGDTLIIKPRYSYMDLQKIEPSEMQINLKHPRPNHLVKNLIISRDCNISKTKNKSGNQN